MVPTRCASCQGQNACGDAAEPHSSDFSRLLPGEPLLLSYTPGLPLALVFPTGEVSAPGEGQSLESEITL